MKDGGGKDGGGKEGKKTKAFSCWWQYEDRAAGGNLYLLLVTSHCTEPTFHPSVKYSLDIGTCLYT